MASSCSHMLVRFELRLVDLWFLGSLPDVAVQCGHDHTLLIPLAGDGALQSLLRRSLLGLVSYA